MRCGRILSSAIFHLKTDIVGFERGLIGERRQSYDVPPIDVRANAAGVVLLCPSRIKGGSKHAGEHGNGDVVEVERLKDRVSSRQAAKSIRRHYLSQ